MDTKPKWKPTHRITSDSLGTFIVMLHERYYYTESLWSRREEEEEEEEAEWAADENGNARYIADGGDPHNAQVANSVISIPPRPAYVPDEADFSDPRLAQIRDVATRVRDALEKAVHDVTARDMTHFPHECCSFASHLLALYLYEHTDLGTFRKVSGGEGDLGAHCWLQQGDIILDITADQFDEGLPAVVVTRHSRWHAAWNGRIGGPRRDDREYFDKIKQIDHAHYSRLLAIMASND